MRKTLFSIALIIICLLMAGLSFAIDPASVENGHVYLFDDVSGDTVPDSSKSAHDGTARGDPNLVSGLSGEAMKFDGVDDAVHIPDSANINSGGPWINRTVMAIFNCADVSKAEKQTIYEEGGRTRGLVIYVLDGEVYVGGWNRAEYNWNGAWISTPIESNQWYSVAFVLRDTQGAVEPDKFEMWLDGKLIGKEPGGQMHGHGDDVAIGSVIQNTVFHDEDGSGDGFPFEGLIDEVWILNEALSQADLGGIMIMTSVEPADKLAASWGTIKTQY